MADAFHVKRLADLVAHYGITPRGRHALATLLDLLASDPNAPTTVVDPDRGVDLHLADSLVALELDAVRQATLLADLGAGAGIPGLPLAAALPDARVVLVESVGRKGAFMERCIAAMGLANAGVVTARAEERRGVLEQHVQRCEGARKIAPTPAGFPRRAGMARKRPLH